MTDIKRASARSFVATWLRCPLFNKLSGEKIYEERFETVYEGKSLRKKNKIMNAI